MLTAACGAAQPEPVTAAAKVVDENLGSDAAAELEGTHWVLEKLNGADLPDGITITLGFADGKARGNAGCNGYGRPYAATDGGGIGFEVLEMTVEGCVEPPGVMALEAAYLAGLNAVGRYRTGEGRLELIGDTGDVLLEFVAAPAE